jgi:NitT/TauT family transport system permease protein/taurine transport system permease protein
LSSLYAVPIVIIYPVIAAWLGLGLESKYVFGGLYGFFPVVLNTVAGIKSIDPHYEVLAKSIGASKLQTIIQIKVPFSLPEILAGIRLGAALAVIGVVVAEMLASSVGLGYLIEFNRTIFRTPNVYLAILIVLFIVGIIDRILYTLENRLVYWVV